VSVEIDRLRRETPGCEHVIHFNHAGSSLMPAPVRDATVRYIEREAEIGGYETADEYQEQLEAVYDSTARLLNASRNEIAIVENATRGWDMAFYAVAFSSGDRILTSHSEYASNVLAFYQMRERGVSVETIPNDEYGQVDVSALAAMMDNRVKAISISHMPTNGGLLQPAAEIGAVARQSKAIYILDACQTAGQVPLDVEAIGCDVLTASGRKFLRSPRGVGFLYVRESLIEQLNPPFIDLLAARWTSRDGYTMRTDARRFENWERNFAGVIGMGVAIDYALDLGMPAIWQRILERSGLLRSRLSSIPGVQTHDLGEIKGGIVTFTKEGVPARAVADHLKRQKINVVVSTVFSTRFDMEDRGLSEIVRASVHYITSDEEIDRFCEEINFLS
jgi:selenocysteine lyase/cysteine desulfurase